MSAHTPGPWEVVVEARPHSEPIYYVTAADPEASPGAGYLEVPFHVGLAGGNSRTRASGRDEANARLIAAAPDLLAVVQDCLESEERRRRDLRDGSPASSYSDARLTRLRAAIAKARGGR